MKTTTTSQEALSDIRAAGFWTRMEDVFFEIRVFHANAPSNQCRTFQAACEHPERIKQLEYEDSEKRIVNIDRGSFCPLVFSTSGAIAPLSTRFLKRLTGKIAGRDGATYSHVMSYQQCGIAFTLLRSSIMCIRGSSRSNRHSPTLENRH